MKCITPKIVLLALLALAGCQKQRQEVKKIVGDAPAVAAKSPSENVKNIIGISVSQYQGKIDWQQVLHSSAQIQFVFVRATKGLTQDTRFLQNWTQVKNNHRIRGAYHYYLPTEDPIRQFKNFASTVALEKGDLPPVLDLERLEGKDLQAFLKDIQKWLDKAEQHFGVQPIIYSYLNFYNRYLKNEFKQYPLWMAMYASKRKRNIRWHFHQFTDQMAVSGINSFVCGENYKGSLASLKDLCLKKTPLTTLSFSRNKKPPTHQPYLGNNQYVYGINFSQYHGKVYWKRLGENRNMAHFIFVRATSGTKMDFRFKENWKELKQLGYVRGAYHVYSPKKPIKEQFKTFASVADWQKGDLPPVLSVGTVGKSPSVDIQRGIKQWLIWSEEHFGVKPLFCTNPYLYNRYFKNVVKGYPLWIVEHSDSRGFSKNQLKGIDWTFHQFSKTTEFRGLSKPIFANHYKGTIEDWNAYLNSISQ